MTKFCRVYGPMPDIKSFKYVFPCDFARKSNEVDIYGTGGMILQDMKDLLVFLPGLKRLELTDLELDTVDGKYIDKNSWSTWSNQTYHTILKLALPAHYQHRLA